ncbi:MAG: cyclic nucleotide-binding domain-containing protein [Planctomycetes bacterium]|nr:cyclic nucleotide-binding domain-containing protein [Planctomycetota bacterium]
MNEILKKSELFQGLEEATLSRLRAVARSRPLRVGEYLFLLGDRADHLYIVLRGKVDLCFPFSFAGVMRDIPIESKPAGGALGWSAFVEPHRFTLSARAAEPSEVAGFGRQELQEVFEADARSGWMFMRRVAAMVGHRLLDMQALWARELQRAMAGSLASRAGASGASDR